MNLATLTTLRAGGPGSGCNPAVGHCGRPPLPGSNDVPSDVRDYVTAHENVFPKAMDLFMHTVQGMGSVAGRVKEPSHVAEKMVRKSVPLDSIHDVIGLRLTTPDIETVYRAFDAVAQKFSIQWVDDRIAKPTDGIYRAIHVDAMLDGKHMEIQLRTANQSALAEFMHNTYYKGNLNADDKSLASTYLKKVSNALFRRDNGQKATLPACPPTLLQKIGCFTPTMMAATERRKTCQTQLSKRRVASSALWAWTRSRRQRRTI